MCDEDHRLTKQPFTIEEGREVFVMYSPDTDKHYMKNVESAGYPMKVLELHSKDSLVAVATVFSYKRGMRFTIALNLEDVRYI